jgi:hypothetical protein
VNFNSEIDHKWAQPVSRRAPRRCRVAAMRRVGTAALSRCRDRAPRVPIARLAFAAPRRPSPHAARLPDSAASPLAPRPDHRGLTPRCPDRSRPLSPLPPSPVACRRLRAGEPSSPPSPVHRRRVVAGSLSSAAAPCAAVRSRRLPCAARTLAPPGRGRGPRQRCARGPCPAWPRAAHALCMWAESTPRAWAPRTVRLGRARIQPSAPG